MKPVSGIEQWIDPLRQPIHAQMRDLGYLADRDRALRPRHHTIGAAHFRDVALQQMSADAAQLVAQHAAGARHRPARHDHAARGESAEPERRALGVAMAHRDPRRVDTELLGGHLRQYRFEALAVRLDADHQDDTAVGQHPRRAALEPWNDRRAARGELRSAVRGLLGKGGKADADESPILLAALLARADRGHVQKLGA
jgi:hypothetical protein